MAVLAGQTCTNRFAWTACCLKSVSTAEYILPVLCSVVTNPWHIPMRVGWPPQPDMQTAAPVCKAVSTPPFGASCDAAYTAIHAVQSNFVQSLTYMLMSLQGFLGVLAIYIGAIAIVIANVGRSKMADTSYCIQVMQSTSIS